jgi:hypothetical protein
MKIAKWARKMIKTKKDKKGYKKFGELWFLERADINKSVATMPNYLITLTLFTLS